MLFPILHLLRVLLAISKHLVSWDNKLKGDTIERGLRMKEVPNLGTFNISVCIFLYVCVFVCVCICVYVYFTYFPTYLIHDITSICRLQRQPTSPHHSSSNSPLSLSIESRGSGTSSPGHRVHSSSRSPSPAERRHSPHETIRRLGEGKCLMLIVLIFA